MFSKFHENILILMYIYDIRITRVEIHVKMWMVLIMYTLYIHQKQNNDKCKNTMIKVRCQPPFTKGVVL